MSFELNLLGNTQIARGGFLTRNNLKSQEEQRLQFLRGAYSFEAKKEPNDIKIRKNFSK